MRAIDRSQVELSSTLGIESPVAAGGCYGTHPQLQNKSGRGGGADNQVSTQYMALPRVPLYTVTVRPLV
jgi:hypothetical protein